jgi:hypothetical protein
MIDISTEHLIRLREVPDHLPRRGSKKLHYSTAYRWASQGVRGPDSQAVLETVRTGGTIYTSVEALSRFTMRLSPEAHSSESNLTNKSSPLARSKRTRDALLDMDGWKPDSPREQVR